MVYMPLDTLTTRNWHCAGSARYVFGVRNKTHGVETRSHSRCVFGTPAFGGGFVLGIRECREGLSSSCSNRR
jgi:hypothetical protein